MKGVVKYVIQDIYGQFLYLHEFDDGSTNKNYNFAVNINPDSIIKYNTQGKAWEHAGEFDTVVPILVKI